jgi:hypothetical protein
MIMVEDLPVAGILEKTNARKRGNLPIPGVRTTTVPEGEGPREIERSCHR